MQLNQHQREFIQAELDTLKRIINYNPAAVGGDHYYRRRMEVLQLFLYLDRLQPSTPGHKDIGYEFT